MIKIDKKIVGYAVAKPDAEEKTGKPEIKREGGGDRAEVIRMHEKLERPEMLVGSTYKVKTPISDHAMYVTINDIVLPRFGFSVGTGRMARVLPVVRRPPFVGKLDLPRGSRGGSPTLGALARSVRRVGRWCRSSIRALRAGLGGFDVAIVGWGSRSRRGPVARISITDLP